MPRPAGEAAKLGDRYEGVWTADTLLDVLDGEAESITVEPFDIHDAAGVEFIKHLPDQTLEFHSVKRQKPGNVWSLADLARATSGPSVLESLAAKLRASPNARVVFVSGTTPNELAELCDRADRSKTATAFGEYLTATPVLKKHFETKLLPLFAGDFASAYRGLRRWKVAGSVESALIRAVEHRIRRSLRRVDRAHLDARAVRLLFGELVLNWLGQKIDRGTVVEWLHERGLTEREWARDADAVSSLDKRRASYLRNVEAELVHPPIERAEARAAFDALRSNDRRHVVILGPAGLGKSCIVADVVRRLETTGVICLPVRLDIQTDALTSKQLGLAVDLPESPAVVLGGVAQGRPCVLVLDQLDALSFASGRNQRLWDAFEESLSEAAEYPNMRVLLACRVFDAEHDPRLRRLLADEDRTTPVKLRRLAVEDVSNVLTAHHVDETKLSSAARDLLRLPLNLSLYVQGDPASQPGFSTEQELLERYLQHKMRQAGSDIRSIEVIYRLSDGLSRKQTLSAPVYVLGDLQADADTLTTLHVLSREGDQYRFFHESFFDYCWARMFAQREQALLNFLLKSEQHLFRRAQVRQILSYRRNLARSDYLRDLQDILGDDRIRFHLKRLTLDWLRDLPDPDEAEWKIVEPSQTGDNAPLTLGSDVLWRSVPWFDLLARVGVWRRWLASPDQAVVSRAIWLLSMNELLRARSADIAALFDEYVRGERPWRAEFIALFRFGRVHDSREMFDLLLWTVRTGRYDEGVNHDWSSFREMPDERPTWAAELIGAVIDRFLLIGKTDVRRPFGIGPDFVVKTAKEAPSAFLRELLPRLAAALRTPAADDPSHLFGHPQWSIMPDRHLLDFPDALRSAALHAMERLGRDEPDKLLASVSPLETVSHRTAERLLLYAWTQNGRKFADVAANFIVQSDDRLNIGYHFWGSGNGHAATSRSVVSAIAPFCCETLYQRLENQILQLVPDYEKEARNRRGYISMLLLACLPAERMSLEATRRFAELKRKFPFERFAAPKPIECAFVAPPISRSASERLTDKNWISALTGTASRRLSRRLDAGKNGIYRLAPELRRRAQTEKLRFAELALRLPDSVPPAYFDAILSGITSERQETGEENKLPETALQPVETETIARVIERLHDLPEKPCGKEIAWAIQRIADRNPPERLLDIVSHYAINDADPADRDRGLTVNGKPASERDPYSDGINSTRGAAAHAIAALLFANKSHYHSLQPAIRALVADRSVAVRSCAVAPLVAMLNFDRPTAVKLFLLLCDGAQPVLKTPTVDEFLHYAVYDRYADLRALLLRMLQMADDAKARETAARQITVAAFHEPLAIEDLGLVFAADATCRNASAGVYAHNLSIDRVADECRRHLPQFFDDEDKDVRATAADCFRRLSDAQLTREQPLMQRFIASRACLEHSEDLVIPLENSAATLPEIICSLPERLIAEHKSSGATEHIEQRRWIYHLPALVTRVYGQTSDAQQKVRCLNIIDEMLRLGFTEVDAELAKVER